MSKKSKSRTGVMGIAVVLLVAFISLLLDQDIGTPLLLAITVIVVMVNDILYMTELSNQRDTVQ